MKSHNKNSLVHRAKKDNSHRLICTFLKLNEDISHIAKQFYRVLCPKKEKKSTAQYKNYSHRIMCTILKLQPNEELSHIAKQFYLVYCARRKKKKAQYSGRMKSHNKNSLVYRAKKDNSHRLICTFLKLNEELSHIAKSLSRVLCAKKEKKAQYSVDEATRTLVRAKLHIA
ncbi:hypothetical protein JTE90_003749 [Oedothorax gibbosus]|uniref:Uncharacterized protein n=1 Tax=Oedothorax gibbosus TaxID=931172 RepID=A0AAV6V9Z0_9ARAC|nr:hypothetical protein JTE90_003749 [Oedothorax gibbosus]